MTHHNRRAHELRWVETLRAGDAAGVWEELRRVVRKHLLMSASYGAGPAGSSLNRLGELADLTQELFLRLLTKNRFRYYLDAGMTDEEIEREIGQLELKNLVTEGLRQRVPESYRMARRISILLRSSPRFRRFDFGRAAGHYRLSVQSYGLREWPYGKPTRGQDDVETRVRAMIPIRRRDTRAAGCAGDSQIIITNPELEGLIARVLEAADAPAEVRALRRLVMSRLPVLDYSQVTVGRSLEESSERADEFVDPRQNPEEALLERELERAAAGRAARFLEGLSARVGGKEKQFERITAVLWHCYLSPRRKTQLQVAADLGVSDSLVSDYRGRIEAELRSLGFTGLAQARAFEAGLRRQLEKARFGPPLKSRAASPRETRTHRRVS